jgi:hypothetical protein
MERTEALAALVSTARFYVIHRSRTPSVRRHSTCCHCIMQNAWHGSGLATRHVVAALAFCASACQNPAQPEPFSVHLEITADTVWIQRSSNEVRFLVPVTVRNEDGRSLFVTPCAHTVQMETSSGWQSVWSSPCSPGRLYSLELSPGESTLLSLLMRSGAQTSDWPATAKAGTYRVVLALTSVPLNVGGIVPKSLSAADRTTVPFHVFARTIVF